MYDVLLSCSSPVPDVHHCWQWQGLDSQVLLWLYLHSLPKGLQQEQGNSLAFILLCSVVYYSSAGLDSVSLVAEDMHCIILAVALQIRLLITSCLACSCSCHAAFRLQHLLV